MKIETLAQLQKLINLCHKNNIMGIEVDGIKLDLGAKPVKAPRMPNSMPLTPGLTPEMRAAVEKIASDELSPEELLFYSVNGESA